MRLPIPSVGDLARDVTGPSNTSAATAAESESEKDGNQRRTLRHGVCFLLLGTLVFEIVALFAALFSQGFGWIKIENGLFGVFTTGILLQTFYCVRTIVTHLFPDGVKESK